jgi:hypothetical protein
MMVAAEDFMNKADELFGKDGPKQKPGGPRRVDVEAYLQIYKIGYKIKAKGTRTIYALDACPFDESHVNNDAAIFQDADGKLGFKCFHDSCQGKGWKDARAAISGDVSLGTFMVGGDGDTPPADIVNDEVQKLNNKHAVIMIGGKCVVINQTIDRVFNRPDISFSSKGDFLNMYANRKIPNPLAPTKQISIGKLWWESPNRKQYEGLVFEPQKNFDGYYNLWRGFAVDPKEGNWTLMERLIREAISSGNEARYKYILAWMARIVQNPGGQRPGVAFVMRGRQGVGKGKFATEFGALLSDHFLQVAQAGQVTGRFNTHLKDCVVLFVDEGFWAGDKQAEGVIKNLVTEPTLTVEPKGKDLFKVKNNVNVLIASNSDWVVPAGLEERRFFTVDVDDCLKGDYDFFKKLTAQMDNGGREAMLYDLQKMDISGVNLRGFERTDALLDQILESMTLVQKWWFTQLRRGAIRMVDYGDEFGPQRDEWPTSASNDQLYDSFELFVAKLKGYLPVPVVFGRQLNKLITPVEIVRPRTPDGAPRRRLRIIPNLERCRKVFEKKLEMEVDWEDEKHEKPPF